jgi:hypothetical protein
MTAVPNLNSLKQAPESIGDGFGFEAVLFLSLPFGTYFSSNFRAKPIYLYRCCQNARIDLCRSLGRCHGHFGSHDFDDGNVSGAAQPMFLPEFDHPAPQHRVVQTELPAQSRDPTTARHHKVTAVGVACALPRLEAVCLIIAVTQCLIYVYVADWETSRDLKRMGFKPELSGSR